MKYKILGNKGPVFKKGEKTGYADIGFLTQVKHRNSPNYRLLKFPRSMYSDVYGHTADERFTTNEYWWVHKEYLVPIKGEPFTDKEYEEIFV